MINEAPTLEDAMHRATRYIELEEERAVMVKKHSPAKHYQKDDRGKKAATYYVRNTQSSTQQPWNKYHRSDDSKDTIPYCDYHKWHGHPTDKYRHLQVFILSKYHKGKIKNDEPNRTWIRRAENTNHQTNDNQQANEDHRGW